MCNIDVALFGCGHERFLRLNFPCPAGFCLEHKECFIDRTCTTRTLQVRAPPFCRQCFDEEIRQVVKSFSRAMDDLIINNHIVCRYYRGQYGSWSIREDHDRIVARLKKIRDTRKLALKREFFGPSGEIQNGRFAFLYEEQVVSHRSHEECVDAFRVADNLNSSDDEHLETSHENNDQYQSPEAAMRLRYGAMTPMELQRANLADNSSSGSSERGEYSREYQGRRDGILSLSRAMEGRPESNRDRTLRIGEGGDRPNSDRDGSISSLAGLDRFSDLNSLDVNGLDDTDLVPVSPRRYNSIADDELQVEGATNDWQHDRVRARAGSETLAADTSNNHQAQRSHVDPEQVHEHIRGRLEQLSTEFYTQQLPSSSTQGLLEEVDSPVMIAGVRSRVGDRNYRQSVFHEHLSEVSEPGSNASTSELARVESEGSVARPGTLRGLWRASNRQTRQRFAFLRAPREQ
ncbi:MAG: hypothetical protein Q9172_002718 [Xanthocarpia lactea]